MFFLMTLVQTGKIFLLPATAWRVIFIFQNSSGYYLSYYYYLTIWQESQTISIYADFPMLLLVAKVEVFFARSQPTKTRIEKWDDHLALYWFQREHLWNQVFENHICVKCDFNGPIFLRETRWVETLGSSGSQSTPDHTYSGASL